MSDLGPRRVVVTGLGAVSGLGHDAGTLAAAVREGRSGVSPARSFDTTGFPQVMAGEVGGVEELCPQSAWGWSVSGALAAGFPVGEGCALFAVRDAEAARLDGSPVLAELLAAETAFAPEGVRPGVAGALAGCVTRALERSGIDATEIGAVSLGATGLAGLEDAERRAVRRALCGRPVTEIRVKDVTGEAYSADGAFQLAAVLATTTAGQLSLVTGMGQDGHVACLVVRTGSPARTGGTTSEGERP